MENLNYLLEISFYTILLFIIVLAIKKMFKDKMSPTLHFLIWFILIARFCIPFTIDSSLRLIVIPEKTVGAFQAQAGGHIQLDPSFSWTDIFFIVWLCGILLLSIRMLVNISGMNREIKRHGNEPSSHIREMLSLCRKELGIKEEIKAFMLPNLTTPALTVGLRPKIILPADIHNCLSNEQLMLVIKHEIMHYKRRDHLIVLLLRILEIIYWFNPVIWLMSRYFSRDMESACDSMVVSDLDNHQKKKYALSLLQLSTRERVLNLMLGLVFGSNEKIIEKRIRRVFHKCQRDRGMMIAAGVMAVVLIIGCFTTIFMPVIKTENAIEDQTANAANITIKEELLNNIQAYHLDNGYSAAYETSKIDAIGLGIDISNTDETGRAITTPVYSDPNEKVTAYYADSNTTTEMESILDDTKNSVHVITS